MIVESNTIFRRHTNRAVPLRGVVPHACATYAVCDDAELRDELADVEPGISALSADQLTESLPPSSIVMVFLPRTQVAGEALLRRSLAMIERSVDCRVCLIGTFRVYLGDRQAAAVESHWLRRFQTATDGKCAVLRTGTITLRRSGLGRRFAAPLYPLLPRSWRSCYISLTEVVATARVAAAATPLRRPIRTLLGTNRTFADELAGVASTGGVARFGTLLATIAACCGARLLIALLVGIVSVFRANRSRPFSGTLEPRSVDELLSLVEPHNQRHVVIAGNNTGGVHFGWKFPGRTVVKTTGCGRSIRVGDSHVDVDAGITLKQLIAELSRHGRELFAVPNYSYIAVGTAFFVPIHGSGHVVSTLGDTIEKVLSYDTRRDQFVVLRRGTADFAETMYAPHSPLLALRLRLRVRPQTRYFMRRDEIVEPDAAAVWNAFTDAAATNIELRKPAAAAAVVQVAKYYASAVDAGPRSAGDSSRFDRSALGSARRKSADVLFISRPHAAFCFSCRTFSRSRRVRNILAGPSHSSVAEAPTSLRAPRRYASLADRIARLPRHRSVHASKCRATFSSVHAGKAAQCSIQSRQAQHVSCRPTLVRRSTRARKSSRVGSLICFGLISIRP
jgi:hypothetical protein